MNKEQAVSYLRFSGFSDEQIKAIEGAFTCEDAISREAVINHICESKDCYKDECKGRLYKRCHDLEWVYELPPVNPQKPCEDAISRKAVTDLLENTNNGWIIDEVLQLPPVVTKEERALLQRWRDNRGVSMEEFAKALELLKEGKA